MIIYIYWVVMVMCFFVFKNYIHILPTGVCFSEFCFTLCQEAISIKDGRPGHFGIAGRFHPYRISVSNCLNQRSKMSKVSWFCKGCLFRIHNQLFVNQSLLIIEVKTGMQIKHLATCSCLLQNQSIAGRLCGSKILHLTRNHVCANISPPVPDANGRFDGLVVLENNHGDAGEEVGVE